MTDHGPDAIAHALTHIDALTLTCRATELKLAAEHSDLRKAVVKHVRSGTLTAEAAAARIPFTVGDVRGWIEEAGLDPDGPDDEPTATAQVA